MSLAAVAVRTAPESKPAPETGALVRLLEQLRDVVTLLPAEVYRARPAARVSGSVGEHVRHALDHLAALVGCRNGDVLCYDRRVRGTTIETDPLTAVNEIDRLLFRLDRWPSGDADKPLQLSIVIDKALAPVLVRSTLARELAFVIQHTIHHCALIAVLLDRQGWRVPADFGLAPATARARAAGGDVDRIARAAGHAG